MIQLLYISPDRSPKLFIEAIGGTWYDEPTMPVLSDANYMAVLVDILSSKYSTGLTERESNKMAELLPIIQTASGFSDVATKIEQFNFGEECKNLQDKMTQMLHLFREDSFTLSKSKVIGICVESLKDSETGDIKAAIVVAALKSLGVDRDSPKMLILDEMAVMLDHSYFTHNIELFYELANIYNIALIGSVDTERYTKVSEKKLWDEVDNHLDLKVVMPHDNINYDLREIFALTDEENDSLSKTLSDSVFIIKPFGRRSTIINFNTSGIEKYIRILSGDPVDIELLEKAKQEKGDNIENWLPELYDMMER